MFRWSPFTGFDILLGNIVYGNRSAIVLFIFIIFLKHFMGTERKTSYAVVIPTKKSMY